MKKAAAKCAREKAIELALKQRCKELEVLSLPQQCGSGGGEDLANEPTQARCTIYMSAKADAHWRTFMAYMRVCVCTMCMFQVCGVSV